MQAGGKFGVANIQLAPGLMVLVTRDQALDRQQVCTVLYGPTTKELWPVLKDLGWRFKQPAPQFIWLKTKCHSIVWKPGNMLELQAELKQIRQRLTDLRFGQTKGDVNE